VLIIVGVLAGVSATLVASQSVDDPIFGRESRRAGGEVLAFFGAGIVLVISGIVIMATGRK
jgi:hypothetical protein